MDRLRTVLVIACCLAAIGCSSSDEDKTNDTGTTNNNNNDTDTGTTNNKNNNTASGSCESKPSSAPLFTSILYDSSSICLKVDPRLPCYFKLEGCGGVGGSYRTVVTFAGVKDSSTFGKVYDKNLTSSTFGTVTENEKTSKMEVAEIPVDTEVTIESDSTKITFKFFEKDGKHSVEIISITTPDCDECPGS